MTYGVMFAGAAVGFTLLLNGVNALATQLGQRDDLNLPVSPPSERRGGESAAGPLSPGILDFL